MEEAKIEEPEPVKVDPFDKLEEMVMEHGDDILKQHFAKIKKPYTFGEPEEDFEVKEREFKPWH